MRLSNNFTKTSKDAPADEVAKNAQLLIRAGYIHKEMAGVYAYLPFGLKVLENIKKIVREEMDAIGGQEVMMTTLQPKDIFEKSDRWDDAKVDNWFKTKLKNGTELGMGLTHEEPIVDALSSYVSSYKDLPIKVYQIQNKFRNELRAKSGLMRGREFVMKDMYSLARSQEEHEKVYEEIAAAYVRIYDRLGIGADTHRVMADGGIFTDRFSDEFQTITDAGEDTLFHVPGTKTYFNSEIAPSRAPTFNQPSNQDDLKEVHSPGVKGVKKLAELLGITVEQTVKTMLYEVDGSVVAVAVRGDYDVNMIKLRKALEAKKVALASEETVQRVTGAEVGYAGLLGLPDEVKVLVDDSCEPLVNFELGANKTDYHTVNVNWGRDLPLPEQFYDIKEVKEGDIHPESGTEYETSRASEVGNIFPLESKYPDALGVHYADENGEQQSIVMGCYGVGVSRLVGVIAEHFSDDKGLVWPENIAPYKVYLVSIGDKGAAKADELYEQLQTKGVDVLYDDRDERPGKKFADAELLGIPYRVTVSDRLEESNEYEVQIRASSHTEVIKQAELMSYITR